MKSYEINAETIPPDLEPDENITLWRYMSFSSLYEILINDYIPLISVRNFSDKSEGLILKEILSKLPNAYEDSVQFAMQKYYETIYISSWHNADNENAAMWDRYTHGSEGIAISTNAKLLLDCIESVNTISKHEFFLETRIDELPENNTLGPYLTVKPVKYTNNNPTDFEMKMKYLQNGYDKFCFFYKLEDFQDESEVRILASTYLNPYGLAQLKPSEFYAVSQLINQQIHTMDSLPLIINSASKLIQQIIVSPYAHSQFIKTVKQSIENINLSRQADPIKCDIIESRRKEWI